MTFHVTDLVHDWRIDFAAALGWWSWAEKWLEEIVSERNTIQASEDTTQPGKTAGPNPRKLYMENRWCFCEISGLINSFRLALCVGLEKNVLLLWIATVPPRKSI